MAVDPDRAWRVGVGHGFEDGQCERVRQLLSNLALRPDDRSVAKLDTRHFGRRHGGRVVPGPRGLFDGGSGSAATTCCSTSILPTGAEHRYTVPPVFVGGD